MEDIERLSRNSGPIQRIIPYSFDCLSVAIVTYVYFSSAFGGLCIDLSICLGGSVTLASADPFTFPLIDPNFLSELFDQETLIEGIKLAFKFLFSAPTLKGYVLAPFGALANATESFFNSSSTDIVNALDDASLLSYARANTGTIYHPVSTARMSPYNASWGVVDPDLRLKGAVGFRVVDASVFVSKVLLRYCQL